MLVLIIGSSGLIGNNLTRALCLSNDIKVVALGRNPRPKIVWGGEAYRCFTDVRKFDELEQIIKLIRPNVVINCAGVTKHVPEGSDIKEAIEINAVFPLKLKRLGTECDFRVIHISSDCVFDGKSGGYSEKDIPNATDIYGITKGLSEKDNGKHLTLRTSTIGHELQTKHGLLNWFLDQSECYGYAKAIFSGLPAFELGCVIRDFLLVDPSIQGLYNIGGDPINKFDLLKLVNSIYSINANIIRHEGLKIDRSLDSSSLLSRINYSPKPWDQLIKEMFEDFKAIKNV